MKTLALTFMTSVALAFSASPALANGTVGTASQATGYRFALIADISEGSSFDLISGPSTLNNAGAAAFPAFKTLPSGERLASIIASDGKSTTTIFSTTDPNPLLGTPWINNAGRVAFRASVNGTEGIFVGSGQGLTTIATGQFDNFLSMNNHGQVAFATGHFEEASHEIFVGSGGPLTRIGAGRYPVINDRGTVVFLSNDQIYTGNGGAVTPITGPATSLNIGQAYSADINDADVVAVSSVGSGVFKVANGQVTTVADPSGPYNDFGAVSINNRGEVAFEAGGSSVPRGIYTGSDPVADKVIALGDSLFGSTVQQFTFWIGELNDRGQVVFNVVLANGTSGVVVATPKGNAAGVHQGRYDKTDRYSSVMRSPF